MSNVWKFRPVEPATVFIEDGKTKGVNGMVTMTEAQWKDWTAVEGPTGIEITPPSKFSTLKIPYAQLFMWLVRPEPEAAKPVPVPKK